MAEPTDMAAPSGPREVFSRMKQQWLGNLAGGMDDHLAEDVVIESPFAPPSRPRRFEGRAEFLAFAEAGRAAMPPVRFEECREIAVHETADPEVIVVEYELAGTVTGTGHRASAAFIGVLRVRDGRIVHWREYQNVLAIAQALGQLPALLASLAGQPEPAAPGAGQPEPAASGAGA
jgi:ketosteroid isomerase-like protein